jgi:transposase
MNKLSDAKRAQVVSAIVEGCSIRSIVRMTGVSKNTIAKLLVELGAALRRSPELAHPCSPKVTQAF